jgi:hypothetical protein
MRPTVVICLVALAAVAAPVDAQRRATFPIEAGLTWTYRGYVRWTGADRRVHGDSITWTMKVVAVRTGPAARTALIHGWVQELAWHEPSKKPTYSVLVARAGRVYQLPAPDSAAASTFLESSVRPGAPAPEPSHLVLDSALTIGLVYGRDSLTSNRDDKMYGWYVASDRVVSAPASWKLASARVRRVTLEYRSLPDYQLIDFVPGVGITRFVFSHGGTGAETDVRLVSVAR